jgi:hypothetical protein
MVSIEFEAETKYGVFRDAIALPDDHAYNLAEIEAMKSARVASWVAMIEAALQEQPVDGDV